MNNETTAKRLQQLLSERNLSQSDVLQKAQPYCDLYGTKLTKSALSQYISGKVSPGQDKLFILSKALNVSVPWLMGFSVEKETPSKEEKKEYFENMLTLYEELDKTSMEIVQKIRKKSEDDKMLILQLINRLPDKNE